MSQANGQPMRKPSRLGWFKKKDNASTVALREAPPANQQEKTDANGKPKDPPPKKKMPVFFIDEAHKLCVDRIFLSRRS